MYKRQILEVTSASGTSSADLKGEQGTPGKDGRDGTDYILTADDRNEIATIVETDINPTLTSIQETANQAETIARGRATGYVFDTLADLDTALTNEEFVAGLVPGDNLYIRAINVPDYWWDGTQKQQLEAEKPDLSGLVKDVRVNGITVVADGIATIPASKNGKYGVIRTLVAYGVDVGADGQLVLIKAENSVIDSRASNYRAIVPQNLDYAVKAAMCDGKGAAWTADEQAAARTRMGAVSSTDVSTAIAEALSAIGVAEEGSY